MTEENEILVPWPSVGANVFVRVPEGKEHAQINVPAPLRDFTAEVLRRNPSWKAIGLVPMGVNVRAFEIFTSDNEFLGKAGWSSFGNGKYIVSSKRTPDHGSKRTKDLKKALTLARKYLIPASTPELAYNAAEEVRSGVLMAVNRKRNSYREAYDRLTYTLQDYVFANWGELHANLQTKEDYNPDIAKLPEQYKAHLSAKQLQDALKGGKGKVVILRGDKCLVCSPSGKGEDHVLVRFEDLPEVVRRNIGLLKLVSDDQLVGGVGYRKTATTFFVLEDLTC